MGRAGDRHRHGQRVHPPAAVLPAAPVPDHPRRPARQPARRQISTANQQVTVVDLHALHDRAQRFVVGVVLAAETERKEAAGAGGLLFTMLDELNKYAPREGSSPIKEVLLDIAERGRSLGIILIGAQQTASEVERRIVSNSSIKIVGRLDPAEAGRPEYGFLPASQRGRATLAKPGTMFVSQPEIPVPLAVEFPFPAWATRLSEVAEPDVHRQPPSAGDGTVLRRCGRAPRRRPTRSRCCPTSTPTTAPSPMTRRRSDPTLRISLIDAAPTTAAGSHR